MSILLKLGFCSANELDKISIVYISLSLFTGMCSPKAVEHLYHFAVGLSHYLGSQSGTFSSVKALGFRILDRQLEME